MFYTHTFTCQLKPNVIAPMSRGVSLKRYLVFNGEKGPIVPDVPEYEDVIVYKVTENTFNPATLLSQHVDFHYRSCQRCGLGLHRQNYVNCRTVICGERTEVPQVLFVGHSPGEQEDVEGFSFVGASGKLLQDLLRTAEFKHNIVLTNIVGCLPRDSLDNVPRQEPKVEEKVACASRLWYLIQAIKPTVVVAFGRIAANIFLDKPKKGVMNDFYCVPPLIFAQTYHPSYLLHRMAKGDINSYNQAVVFFRDLDEVICDNKIKDSWEWPKALVTFPYLKGVNNF